MNCLPYNSASWLGTWGWIAGSWGPPNSQKYVSWAGWCFQPLWKIFVSWDYYSQYMESHKIPWFQTTKQWVLWGIKSSKNIIQKTRCQSPGQFGPKFGPPNCTAPPDIFHVTLVDLMKCTKRFSRLKRVLARRTCDDVRQIDLFPLQP